jgi:hypothetical protein
VLQQEGEGIGYLSLPETCAAGSPLARKSEREIERYGMRTAYWKPASEP